METIIEKAQGALKLKDLQECRACLYPLREEINNVIGIIQSSSNVGTAKNLLYLVPMYSNFDLSDFKTVYHAVKYLFDLNRELQNIYLFILAETGL